FYRSEDRAATNRRQIDRQSFRHSATEIGCPIRDVSYFVSGLFRQDSSTRCSSCRHGPRRNKRAHSNTSDEPKCPDNPLSAEQPHYREKTARCFAPSRPDIV